MVTYILSLKQKGQVIVIRTKRIAAVLLMGSVLAYPITTCAAANAGASKLIGEKTQQAIISTHLCAGATAVLSNYRDTALRTPVVVAENATEEVGTASEVEIVEEAPQVLKEYNIPSYEGFKTWMPYKAITSKSSPQYKLQQQAYTDSNGFRKVGDRFCVAIGTYFGLSVGDEFTLVLENGERIDCIVGDIKADRDTESNCIFTRATHCMSEFIVDKNCLNKKVKQMGDCSYAYNWDSRVVKLLIYT